ncbi:MAG: YiiX/YebB-like N1pC/P60 family cysteine hydrolase [Bacteroidales bacterium]
MEELARKQSLQLFENLMIMNCKRMKPTQLIIMVWSLICLSCNAQSETQKLKTGDLLFQAAGSSSLSQAIDKVTQTDSATHYSHVGIAKVKDDGSVVVLHASIEGGTCEVSLNDFLNPKGKTVQTVLYRLKKKWQNTIPDAVIKAEGMLGKPYNFSYVLSDSSHYCSEFIYKAFEKDSVFELNPMTFKDPKTGEFLQGWVQHYQNLGIEIPEEKLGCNPNGMAASDKLECLGRLNLSKVNSQS